MSASAAMAPGMPADGEHQQPEREVATGGESPRTKIVVVGLGMVGIAFM